MIHGDGISHGHGLFRWQIISQIRATQLKRADVTLKRVRDGKVDK